MVRVVAVVASLGLSAAGAAAGSTFEGGPPGCDRGPSNAPSAARYHLDRVAADWGVFCDVPPPRLGPNWAFGDVAAPSLDGQSLRLALTGGPADYGNAHFYRTFLPEPAARDLVLTLWFRFEPTTCSNAGSPSTIQAIEFAANKWQGGQRHEVAVQWRNVGDGAPEWRYWDPARLPGDAWVPLPVPLHHCLAGDTWHYLRLKGTIVGDTVRYDRLVVDAEARDLSVVVPAAAAPGEPDRLGIAVQLDGNFRTDPYSVFVDQVHFLR
jgi:hypothetical protein